MDSAETETAPTSSVTGPPSSFPGSAEFSPAPPTPPFDTTLDDLPAATTAAARDGRRHFYDPWTVETDPLRPEQAGLGPLFNAVSCADCHAQGGAAHPPQHSADPSRGLTVLLEGPDGEPDAVYGSHLQQSAAHGVPPEGVLSARPENHRSFRVDGVEVLLVRPHYEIVELGYGPLHPDTRISVRIAPSIAGLGLLQVVDDPGVAPERFGWRATESSLSAQAALAFHQDLGITTTAHPLSNCTAVQTACLAFVSTRGPEMDDDRLEDLTTYLETLAPPSPRNTDRAEVRRGSQQFERTGCADCHTPTHRIHADERLPVEDQIIAPYTDLQLHDLGAGLADDPDDPNATSLWRTPPLWGIGLRGSNGRPAAYLHDGRASSLVEAILWHEGEATDARDAFLGLTAEERADLLAFLDSR